VTQKSHRNSTIYYKDEQGQSKYGTSWLDLTVIETPLMTMEEIRKELNRSMSHLDTWQKEIGQEYFVDKIHQVIPQARYLKIVLNSFELKDNLTAEQRWNLSKTEYVKHYPPKKQEKISINIEPAINLIERFLRMWKDFKTSNNDS